MVQLQRLFEHFHVRSKKTFLAGFFASVFILVVYFQNQKTASKLYPTDSNDEEPLNIKSHVNKPLTNQCSGFYELTKINFNDKAIKSRLCENFEAFTKVNGKYPLCQLSSRLPRVIQNEVFNEAFTTYMISNITGNKVTVFGYNGYEYVTQQITQHRNYEGQLPTGIIKVMQTLPKGEVTFLDVGSNIGAYSLMVADAGFPVVAVDANIRNLIRIQFSARYMGWPSDRLRVFWSFFHFEVSLENIYFAKKSNCHDGIGLAGTNRKSMMRDPVPVMTASADDLVAHIHTPLVVMKVDIELSERVFFETGKWLLKEKNVVVVQMEWFRYKNSDSAASSPHHRFLVTYFGIRNYVLLSPVTLKRLDPENFHEWEALWVKADYVETVRKSLGK